MYNLSVCRRTKHSLPALLASLSAVCLFAPGTASALDFDVQPRLNSGVMFYEFEQDPVFSFDSSGAGDPQPGFALGNRTLSDVMPFVGGGLTLFVNRFFLDVYAQGAFSGEDDDVQQNADIVNQTLTEVRGNTDWDRQEYSASFGYSVTDNFALFAGYRFSNTEFNAGNIVATTIEADDGVIIDSGPGADQTLDYEEDGPFVGGRYNWPIGDVGNLGLNLGVAFVNGDVTFEPDPGTSGDTIATTIGVSYIAPLPVLEGFNYTIGVDGYQYSFEADDDTEAGDVADFSETIVRASAGVSYLF